MDYEWRMSVENVAVSSQAGVQRDPIQVYDMQRPASIVA